MGESVSFGKYENDDGLCWEKWSPSNNNNNNKYLEEVGKWSTPGSVAEKKAFFDAHYKKIAAMKLAAEAEEELQDSLIKQDDGSEDKSTNEPPITVNSNAGEEEEEGPINTKLVEAAFVNSESMNLVKQHFHVDLQTPEIIIPPQNVVSQKLNTKKVEEKTCSVVAGVKKKPAAASRKPKETSNKAISAPSSSSLTNNKKPESHLSSMSMNSSSCSSSSSSSSVRRRSLFMEQMGDKDIVKRAFKTFQNNNRSAVNHLPSSSSSSSSSYDHTQPKQQLPTTKRPAEQKTSTSMSYQKENGRHRSLKEVGSVDSTRGPSNERRKEFFKKLEERSNARGEAERSSKLKEIKDAEMKKVKQKAKPASDKETIKRGSW